MKKLNCSNFRMQTFFLLNYNIQIEQAAYMKSHFRFLDFFILLLVLCSGIYLTLHTRITKADSINVTADGKVYEYSLSKDAVYEVSGSLGKTRIQVENGKVRILESACSGKNCVNQGWGHTLVCLPNKVIVTLNKGEEFDAISE